VSVQTDKDENANTESKEEDKDEKDEFNKQLNSDDDDDDDGDNEAHYNVMQDEEEIKPKLSWNKVTVECLVRELAMFGQLRQSVPILKDALAINLAFTFGCGLSQLSKFYWEYILIADKINGHFFVNVPILLPVEKSSNYLEEKEEYLYIRVSKDYWDELYKLVQRIVDIEQTISNWSYWLTFVDNVKQENLKECTMANV
jgi:hypothetical protein